MNQTKAYQDFFKAIKPLEGYYGYDRLPLPNMNIFKDLEKAQQIYEKEKKTEEWLQLPSNIRAKSKAASKWRKKQLRKLQKQRLKQQVQEQRQKSLQQPDPTPTPCNSPGPNEPIEMPNLTNQANPDEKTG